VILGAFVRLLVPCGISRYRTNTIYSRLQSARLDSRV
jgi:hypothetical protein